MTAYSFNLLTSRPPWDAGAEHSVRAYFDVSTTSGGAGLANTDTITATGMLPGNGIVIREVLIMHPELDSNATPTGTFNVGDTNLAARFISAAPMGVNGITTTGFQMRTGINITTTTTSGSIVSGAGYQYTGTSTNSIVVTVASAVATQVTAGILHVLVTYRCIGNA